MKALIATKTAPVTQNVMFTAVSIEVQLEAMGVKYQGVRK